MYRLLDLRACGSDLKLTPQNPLAVLDSENVLIAAVGRTGHLVYHNRAFMEAFKGGLAGKAGLDLREALPEVWRQVTTVPRQSNNSLFKIVNLLSPLSSQLLGYLLVSIQRENTSPSNHDLFQMLNEENLARFTEAYTGLYVADPHADTLQVNPAYEKIAFLLESDLVGRNLRELEERGYFSKSVTLRVLEQLERGETGEVSFVQKIITGQEVVATGKPVFDESGGLAYILTFVQNLLPLDKVARKLLDLATQANPVSMALPAERTRNGAALMVPEESHLPLPAFDSVPLVVRDPASFATLRKLLEASRYDSPILLTGETGVGKDMMAQYVHQVRAKAQELPFVSVNCSAIPADLLESELFGYEEGAFSGAKAGGKPGLLEEAHGGTLFLNEIGEMPLGLQAKLLTVLDEKCVRRLGGRRAKQVSIKIICATNRDLLQCVEEGTFRSDLYYRINVLEIRVPPLRERPRDILPLVHHFMTQLARRHGLKKYLSADVQDILLSYAWPGNIREIRNLVERLVIFSTTEQIAVGDLPSAILRSLPINAPASETGAAEDVPLKDAVKEFERDQIEKALVKHGTVTAAAAALGIDPTTLGRKLKKP